MLRLLLATRNPHKTREFADILGPQFEVADLCAEKNLDPVEETGNSFEENAAVKALAASRINEGFVIADDSGLEVDALRGAPGIYSARFAGPGANDAANVTKLLHALEGVEGRTARFHCAIALAQNGQLCGFFHGAVEGTITNTPGGKHGFGYDPVFVPNGFTKTFAELGAAVKNSLSHRRRAIEQLREHLLADAAKTR